MFAQGLTPPIVVADGMLKLSDAKGEVQTPGQAFRSYCERQYHLIAFCVIEGATCSDLVHVWNDCSNDPAYMHY